MRPPDNDLGNGSPGVRHCLAVIFVSMMPVAAQAQQISNTVALAALSPIIVVILAGTVGWLERELLRGLIDVGLVLLWVVAFAVLSAYATIDWIIWTPVALYALHAAWIVYRLIKVLIAR